MQAITRSVLALTFALTVLSNLPSTLAAQNRCVQCKPSGLCFSCATAASGGCTCTRVSCSSCTVDIPCATGTTCVLARAGSQSGEAARRVKIDQATILEIGRVHPRMAVSLLTVNHGGGHLGWSKVYTMAARIDPSEVVHWLDPADEDEGRGFFQELKKRAVAGAEPPAVEFNFERMDDGRAVLRGRVVQAFEGDPRESDLEISLADGKVVSWKLK